MKLRILKAKIASSAPNAMMSDAISQGTLSAPALDLCRRRTAPRFRLQN